MPAITPPLPSAKNTKVMAWVKVAEFKYRHIVCDELNHHSVADDTIFKFIWNLEIDL
jgi:hypothetical protein